jgi:hypothetical protein
VKEGMLATQMSQTQDNVQNYPNPDQLAAYSRTLHDYTLRLWSESRRLAEEKLRAQEMPLQDYSGMYKPQRDSN